MYLQRYSKQCIGVLDYEFIRIMKVNYETRRNQQDLKTVRFFTLVPFFLQLCGFFTAMLKEGNYVTENYA